MIEDYLGIMSVILAQPPTIFTYIFLICFSVILVTIALVICYALIEIEQGQPLISGFGDVEMRIMLAYEGCTPSCIHFRLTH